MFNPRISRRSALNISGLGALGLTLSACSTTSNSGSSNSTNSSNNSPNSKELVLWTWPEGFAKEVLDSVSTEFSGISIRQDVIGGEFKQKLTTALQARADLPAITGIKGEDIAFFSSQADFFIDLNTLGAADHKNHYLEYKWDQATTTDGRQLGIPIDIGPTAHFYRFDIFEKFGLPSDPDQLAQAIREWDDYFEMGAEMKAKDPETFLIRNLNGVFDTAIKQGDSLYVDENGKFIGGESHVKQAWDTAIKAHTMGISASLQSQTPDTQAAVANGKLPANFGASWHLADLMVDAPETAGKWHVCEHPGTATNNGGSFLGIPAGTEDPQTAFDVILHILNAQNQIIEYKDKGNFPANKEAFDSEAIKEPVEFLGGQAAGEIFARAAETVRPLYEHPHNSTVGDPFFAELTLVDASGKDPEQAFKDAVSQAERLAEQLGLSI